MSAMPSDNFLNCLNGFLWQKQWDGQPYHVTPGDPGDGTSYGVTEGSWSDWRASNKSLNLPPLANATQAQLVPLIRARYWLAAGCNLMPIGVDLVLLDDGFAAGTHTAAMRLQKLLKMADIDGWVGPATQAAAKAQSVGELIDAVSNARLAAYRQLSDWPLFGKGWTNRIVACQALAHKMSNTPSNTALPLFPTIADSGADALNQAELDKHK